MITGAMPNKLQNGEWLHPKSAVVLKAAGLHTIAQYIRKRCHTVATYIIHCSVFEMVSTATRLTGTPPRQLWCNQGIALPDICESHLPLSPHHNIHAVVVQRRAHSALPLSCRGKNTNAVVVR